MKSRELCLAVEAGETARRWLAAGYGYEITGLDVREAFQFTMEAARNACCKGEARERITRVLSENHPQGDGRALWNECEQLVEEVKGHALTHITEVGRRGQMQRGLQGKSSQRYYL